MLALGKASKELFVLLVSLASMISIIHIWHIFCKGYIQSFVYTDDEINYLLCFRRIQLVFSLATKLNSIMGIFDRQVAVLKH